MLWHTLSLQWRHNDHDGVSNHQPHGCLPNRLFRHRSKKTSKLRVTGLCVGNSPGPGITRTKDQWRIRCFHLMTSSWILICIPKVWCWKSVVIIAILSSSLWSKSLTDIDYLWYDLFFSYNTIISIYEFRLLAKSILIKHTFYFNPCFFIYVHI